MICKVCRSNNQNGFNAEINIHFRGLEHLEKPPVLVYPKLVICLHCGFTEFTLPEGELRALANAAAGAR